MTDWAKLAEPFPDNEIKTRPGSAGMTFRYVDARVVAQRLDDVLTPEGWAFTWTHIPGEMIVHGRLEIIGSKDTELQTGIVREDAGYPNSDRDEEPLKAAVSDALKRCAVLFGVGRHLYDDNAHSRSRPQRPLPPVHVVNTAVAEVEDDDWLPPQDAVVRSGGTDTVTCPIHDVPWAGSPGDLWHKGPEGYCRHPDNVKRAKTAR